MMARKKPLGLTLMELLIAITILSVVCFVGSSVFLSGSKMHTDALELMQAQTNAQLALMHIRKNVTNTKTEFKISNNSKTVEYMLMGATAVSQYFYDEGKKIIKYLADRNDPSKYFIVANNIASCTFDIQSGEGIVLHVDITSTDNSGKNNYNLESRIQANAAAMPPIERVS